MSQVTLTACPMMSLVACLSWLTILNMTPCQHTFHFKLGALCFLYPIHSFSFITSYPTIGSLYLLLIVAVVTVCIHILTRQFMMKRKQDVVIGNDRTKPSNSSGQQVMFFEIWLHCLPPNTYWGMIKCRNTQTIVLCLMVVRKRGSWKFDWIVFLGLGLICWDLQVFIKNEKDNWVIIGSGNLDTV